MVVFRSAEYIIAMNGADLPICHLPDGAVHPATGTLPAVLLPGSFNPLHAGHRELAAVVQRRTGGPVHFELSVANVAKPDVPPEELRRRLRQFAGYSPVWVTRAATFLRKAEHFPGVAFAVGFDTAVRIVDPTYYGGTAELDRALETLLSLGCRVIVGGRVDAAGTFRVWDDMSDALPPELAALFDVIPESEFRVDVSSTALRGERK